MRFDVSEPSRTGAYAPCTHCIRCSWRRVGPTRPCHWVAREGGETRCAGCLCTSSGWFKHVKPPQTFSNHIIAEMTRCVEFFHMSSGCTELSLTTSLQGKQGVQGACAGGCSSRRFDVGREGSVQSNHPELM